MSMKHAYLLAGLLAVLAGLGSLQAADPKKPEPTKSDAPKPEAKKPEDKKPAPVTEDTYYKLLRYAPPPEAYLESGSLEFMPDGKLAVSSRRGEIWMVENPLADDPKEHKYTLFAQGLHEVLGLAQHNGVLYATQRPEITRIKDTNGDGRADLFETVSDGWEITGDYHEYAFGSKFDKNGDMWVVLCLTGSFSSPVKYRGWCVRVNADGKLTPTCAGIRSPGGIGSNAEGELFYTDNQGPWNGTCGLKHLVPGTFQGHPDGLRWYKDNKEAEILGPVPPAPKSGSRIMAEAKKNPKLEPTSVMLPYGKMGNSASGIACDISGGKFGPFEKQLFVGDQSASTVMRVYMEKVNGHYQGAIFPFRSGIGSGTLAMLQANDGSIVIGGTNRGWGSRGNKPFSLERLVWTGEVPFEVKEMKAKPDGFELVFTKPVDPATAGDVKSYQMKTYTYIFQASYGSPEVDPTTPMIEKAVVSPDKMSVRLTLSKLEEGHVHELVSDGVRSAEGLPLLHKQAYYTLNYIPGSKADISGK